MYIFCMNWPHENHVCITYVWLFTRYKPMSKRSLLLSSHSDDNSGLCRELGQKYEPINFLNVHASQFAVHHAIIWATARKLWNSSGIMPVNFIFRRDVIPPVFCNWRLLSQIEFTMEDANFAYFQLPLWGLCVI